MKTTQSAVRPEKGNVPGREIRVERRFLSERKTKEMLQSLIRAHVGHRG